MYSKEAHIIADAVDQGMSTLAAWQIVNYHREVDELPLVCIYDVGTCIDKLKLLLEKLKNKKQGSLNENLPTCKARFLRCLQLYLWLIIITVGDTQNILVEKKIIKTNEVKLPKQFDPANLTKLFVDQFVTCDEVHSEVITGYGYGYVRTPSKDHIMKFPRYDNGNLDVSNGTYSR